MTKIVDNIAGLRDMTADEQAQYDKDLADWNSKSATRKLNKIKKFRKRRLEATDYMSFSDVTMPDYIKTWRQTLRDLPANHTDEDAYDTLLERNDDKSLKHSVWTQPTS
tara:strand:- start:40 stop:366 length:327 start_codon:yes stop_codon:yes gene_type:complete